MKGQYILSVDQGTTGTRAFLFNKRGALAGSDYKEFRQYFPKPGWVEHDADEIWQSCISVIKGVLAKTAISPKRIVAIGITNQRETAVLWDRRTSKPVARAIVWQCRRTADICSSLREKKYEPLFRRKTGLVIDPYFSGTKIKWYLDNIKGLKKRARKGDICFGTVDSWLIWKLTGGSSHVTDMTNASRTLIFNIRRLKWDKELLEILGIPSSLLPRVQNSGSIFGYTAKNKTTLPPGIPITAVLGDQQASLYGQGCFEPGTLKNTYGTGCFLVLNTGKKVIFSKKGLLSTIAADAVGRPVYALEGAVFIAGAVIQWLRDQLKIIKKAADTEKIIRGLESTGGVYFVPAFTGLGAPYWDSNARGLVCGITRGTQIEHIVRAALEAIAYQTKDVFDVMRKEYGLIKNPSLHVDGGACNNDFLMQFQADLLRCRIIRPAIVESTALGAAYLAGITAGVWSGKRSLEKLRRIGHVFVPRMRIKQSNELYKQWLAAVRKTRA